MGDKLIRNSLQAYYQFHFLKLGKPPRKFNYSLKEITNQLENKTNAKIKTLQDGN